MSTNQRSRPDSLQILRHQYGISVAEAQTFLLAKRPCGVKGLYSQASFWGEGTTGVTSEKPVRAKRETETISTHMLTAGFEPTPHCSHHLATLPPQSKGGASAW